MRVRRSLLVVILVAVATGAGAAEPVTNSIGMRLVPIDPGAFTMGQDGPPVAGNGDMATHHAEFHAADWDEKPAHRVTITRPFSMAATEVTVAQYRRFDPDFRKSDRGWRPADDEAVAGVTWTQAVAFCDWLSTKEGKPYRLPTEAEWEYACRAGTTTLFHTGDTLPPGHQKWFGRLGWRDLYFPNGSLPREYAWRDGPVSLVVGQSAANAWGLSDMHGNVAEWCLDWYGPYEAGPQSDPLGRVVGDCRVFRGGGHSELTRLTRSANRGGWIPDAALPAVGFRVVLGELPDGKRPEPPALPLHAERVVQESPVIEPKPADVPFMEGPRLYRQIPPGQVGPLFTRHNHSPGLTECPNGDLLAVWYSCISEPGPELSNAASRLRFGARDWEPPSPFWDGPDINDHGPKLWWDGDRTLLHLVFIHNGGSICRRSTDSGATWSPATPLPVSGEWGNRIIRTRDGVLVISLDGASLVVSRDDGRTWAATGDPKGASDVRPGGTGSRIAGIHAPLVELADGRLMAVGRFDGVDDQERFGFKMPVSYTSDLGASWRYEASEFPVVSSTQRPVLLRLREGPILLCSFTDQARDLKKGLGGKGLPFRWAGGEYTGVGLFAAVSYDEGKTWPDRRLIVGPAEPVANTSGVPPNTNGYLALIQARDGRLHLLTSSRHYSFNLAWIKQLPPAPQTASQPPAAAPPTVIWDPRATLPKAAELPQVQGAEFHVIKPRGPDTDGCRWTLGVGLCWHEGRLYASYGFNKGDENTPTEEAHVRSSDDGGKTWGPPVVMDDGPGNLGVSHGVFLSHAGRLRAFMGAFYDRFERTHTRAYELDETTGRWTKAGVAVADGFWPMQEPQPMADGNWIMAGFRVAKGYGDLGNLPAVAISRGDDLTAWDLVVIEPDPGLSKNLWGESTVIVDGKKITNIARYGGQAIALVSTSDDCGRTWTRAAASNLPMTTSKPYGGMLSSGQRYLVCTTTADSGGRRSPLTIAVSRPGESTFSRVFRIRDSVSPATPGVSDPRADFSYPYAVEHAGRLFIGSTHKSHAANELAIIPVESLRVDPPAER